MISDAIARSNKSHEFIQLLQSQTEIMRNEAAQSAVLNSELVQQLQIIQNETAQGVIKNNELIQLSQSQTEIMRNEAAQSAALNSELVQQLQVIQNETAQSIIKNNELIQQVLSQTEIMRNETAQSAALNSGLEQKLQIIQNETAQSVIKNNELIQQILNQKTPLDGGDIYFDKYYSRNNYSYPNVCTTQICNQTFFQLPLYQFWIKKIGHLPLLNRKHWEWVYICQTLYENGMLQEGKTGLCFGCGKEPLISLFASMGCKILATDLDLSNEKAKDWLNSNQHIQEKNDLYYSNICEEQIFLQNVNYKNVDMNEIPENLGEYDFLWSACSLEHLGGYDNGFQFIKNSLKHLKTGGIAVHTTEYNLSSNDKTSENIYSCIYREKDIEDLISQLELLGFYVFPFSKYRGREDADNFVDHPPYEYNPHLRLFLDGYVTTSCGIIIKKHNG